MIGLPITSSARVYHVSQKGNDSNYVSRQKPLRTLSAAARLAHAGDIILVHLGIYRESVDPIRGGDSDHRIVYPAAKGEKVAVSLKLRYL
ncbi:MAG: DUF1565 domain-containing protein [Runella zeae]